MLTERKISRRDFLKSILPAVVVAGGSLESLINTLSSNNYKNAAPLAGLVVAMYHNFDRPSLGITTTTLADDMQLAVENGWELTTPQRVSRIANGDETLTEKILFLPTLDDGFLDQPEAIKVAHNRFSGRYEWGLVWSVISNFDRYIDRGLSFKDIPDDTPSHRVGDNPNVSGFNYYKWEYATKAEILDTLSLNPNFCLGIHTVSHLPLTRSDIDVDYEIYGSIFTIKDFYKTLGRDTSIMPIAYPEGRYNNRVLQVCEGAGVSIGMTKESTGDDNSGLLITQHPLTSTILNPLLIPRSGRS